jgi:predicted Zn-dependent peptidase
VVALILIAQLAAATPTNQATRFELSNGLRVWVQPDRSRPVAFVQVTYKVGSLHETAGMTGIAHYVEHMVYRATENIRNEDIYGYIDRIGGRYTGGTWPDVTKYGELVPSWAIESALRVTAERMTRAIFDSLEFERERSNVIAETNGYADQDPLSAFQDAMLQASFELHPYRYNSNTWARDNLVLTRAQAFEWYKRYYGPNNAVLAVVGDVDVDSVRAMVERHFRELTRAPESGRITIVEPPQRAEKRVIMTAPKVEKRLEILWRAPPAAHPDYPVLAALHWVLLHKLGKPFLKRSASEFWVIKDSATQYPYVFRIGIPANPSENLERLLGTIQSQIDSIAAGRVTAEELQFARQPPGVLSAPLERASSGLPPRRSYLSNIADTLTARETESWEVGDDVRRRIDSARRRVTVEDLSRYAKRWLRTSQRTVGFLVQGKDDFDPRWTDERTLALDRTEIPPLTTPPAPRNRPEAVPARALEPLAPIRVPNVRRILENGIILRAGTSSGNSRDSVTQIRVNFSSELDSAGVARLVKEDTALARLRPWTWWNRVGTRTTYTPAPLSVAIAAPARIASVEQLTTTAAAALSKLHRRVVVEAPQPPPHVPGEERVPQPDSVQVSIRATLPGVPRGHPDRRALELLNYIVGVPSYGGRLGWALTKTGLTYSSSAATTFGESDGQITLRTASNPSNVDAVIQAIREVVQGVGEDGVMDWELLEAQAFTLGRTVLYGAREDSDAAVVAHALAESELTGLEQLDLPALSRAYLSVTHADLNRVARTYYRADRLRIVATGGVRPRSSEKIFPEGTFRGLFRQ